MAHIFGNLSQSVNLSDIKPPLGMLPTFFCNFISTMFYLEVDSLMRVLNVVDSGLHPLLQSRAAPYAVCFQGCCKIKSLCLYLFSSLVPCIFKIISVQSLQKKLYTTCCLLSEMLKHKKVFVYIYFLVKVLCWHKKARAFN